MPWFYDILSVEACVLLFLLFVLGKLYLVQKWSVLKKWNIPHDPPSIRNLGNITKLVSDDAFTYELECKRRFGLVWGYYTFLKPRLVIHDLEILRQICIKGFSDFPNRVNHSMQLNGKEMVSGLLAVNGDSWKRTRTTLAPTFSTSKLKQISGIVDRCVDNTLKALQIAIKNGNGHFSASHTFQRLSLDVICNAAFSTDINSQDTTKEEPPIAKHARNFFAEAFFNFRSFIVAGFPFLAPFFVWLGGRRESVLYLKKVCSELMERNSGDMSSQKRVDLMQLMLESKIADSDVKIGTRKGLTSTEIIGNAMTMMLAAYETTSAAMSYLAYNLALHPKIQDKIKVEIDQLYQRNLNPDFDAVNSLKFLDMCIHETLRLYCPVTFTLRTAKKEVTLSGLTIPKGVVVIIPIYSLCHDPELWEKPMEFRPERMEDMSAIDPVLLQPFGAGPRNCIGSKFAMMEIKLAFCKILKGFTFKASSETPQPPLKLTFGATSRPKVDLALCVEASKS